MRRLLLLILAVSMAHAETRRALIVGIDRYMQPSRGYQPSAMTRERMRAILGQPSRTRLDSLEGAYNDAEAMKEILVRKFGFKEENVIVLPNPNQPASADNILGLLKTFLIDQAQPGDTSLFYFAGHGSRIRNLVTTNPDGFDSTIVPADALLGVPDIRGKELARIYALAPKKRVALTVIVDSCYSGAASRGAVARNRLRSQGPDLAVSVKERLDGPLPEDAGVLVMAASQEFEPAAELASTDLDGPHGAFTWALLHVLGASPANERVDRIFQRARALMQSRAPGQEPVLLAKNGLNARGLFGQTAGAGEQATIAAARVIGNTVKLNGGLAMNLHEGCELKRVQPAGAAARIRVVKVNGLGSSDAAVFEGAVRPGDLFEIEKWAEPDGPELRVFVGPTAPRAEIDRAIQAADELRRRGILCEEATTHAPTHIVEWDGARWTLRRNQAGVNARGVDLGSLADALDRNAKVNLMIPAPVDLIDLRGAGSVTVVDSSKDADYVLLGRASANQVEYAWALPDATEDDLGKRPLARPLRSDWIALNDSAGGELRESAAKLARVAGWVQLSESAPASSWPYRLALKRTDSSRVLEQPQVRAGERYTLVLRADPGLFDKSALVAQRRVYVFVVDSWGQAKLLAGDGNIGNLFPRFDAASPAPPRTIDLGVAFDITPPFGTDHYFLLTATNPIDAPETVLSFDGVRTRGAEVQPSDPLARLLRNTVMGKRGGAPPVPVNWSIEHIPILSLPPDEK